MQNNAFVKFKDSRKEPIDIIADGEKEMVFAYKNVTYVFVKKDSSFYAAFWPDPKLNLSNQFDTIYFDNTKDRNR